MSVFEDKRYCIDPGKGKKMDGCPYSIYEDGHDVQDYIVPPKGYTFVGFKFDPYTGNQIYDGKLYAQYEKEPFKVRLKANLWKLILPLAIVLVVVLIAVLVISVFKPSKSSETPSRKQKTEILNDSTEAKKDEAKPAKIESPAANDSKGTVKQEEKVIHNENNSNTTQPVNQEQIIQTEAKPVTEETQAQPDDLATMFKKEFWAMIHERNGSMDDYTELFNNYKSKVKKGEEFDYLRFTILKNYVSFKAWYEKLKAIPVDRLSSIESIDELRKYLKE